jgi:hypothetical protein
VIHVADQNSALRGGEFSVIYQPAKCFLDGKELAAILFVGFLFHPRSLLFNQPLIFMCLFQRFAKGIYKFS